MEPTDQMDIDRFDDWLDRLTEGIASPAPADVADLADTALWLQEKGHDIMISPDFSLRWQQRLQPSLPGTYLPAPSLRARPFPPAQETPAISHRALMAAAAALLIAVPTVLLVFRLLSGSPDGSTIPAPANGFAQVGTPVPCSIEQPTSSVISGTPVNDAILVANTNRPYPNAPGSGGPVLYEADLPIGPSASPGDVAAIQQVLAKFATCLYQNNIEQLEAFFSDDTFRRSGSNRTEEPLPTVTPDPTLVGIPTPIRPLDSRTTPVTPVILRSNVLPDGRVGVLLEEDITGYGLLEYFIMVQSERGWLIDEEVKVTPETRPSPEASSLTIPITAIDLQFQPSRIEIPEDVDVTLVVTNVGQARKTFVVPELNIAEELPAGESITRVINAPRGVYEFYSDVPGQRAAGMQGFIIVLP